MATASPRRFEFDRRKLYPASGSLSDLTELDDEMVDVVEMKTDPEKEISKKRREIEPARHRIGIACEACNRYKLKCSISRPCVTCERRGIQCIEKPNKPRACIECKSRKIKCDQAQPCSKCVKHNRICRTEKPNETPSLSRLDRFEDTFDYAQVWKIESLVQNAQDEPAVFDLSAFEFDDFPSITPFWPDPAFHSPPSQITGRDHSIAFDDFDRSRLIHDIANLPPDCRGDLPPSNQLTQILHQYFEYVDPYTPVVHVPSFSIKACTTPFLLILLAIGDVYSKQQTVERWARKAFRYLVRKEIDRFETSSEELSLSTIQALSMWISELTYSGDQKTMLVSAHCRLTLAHAIKTLVKELSEPEVEECWITWIRRESIRRTLMVIYRTETGISMYLGGAPMVSVSELRVPLPDCDELWYAESGQKWQQIRSGRTLQGIKSPSLRFDQVLSDLMHTGGQLVSQSNGVVGLHVVAVGVHELILMARRLREVEGSVQEASSILLAKSREVLEAWKASWLANERTTSTTKAQYIAVMSTWCCAELSLSAPDYLLQIGHRVAISDDVPSLVESFLREADRHLSVMDGHTFNNLMTAAAAALYHVEVISEFQCLDDCLHTIRATVYPNVIASFFVGGLCLWYCIRVLEQIGKYVPDTRNQILPRLKKAVEAIRWQNDSPLRENKSVTFLLGDLLMRTKVWGKSHMGGQTNLDFSYSLGQFLKCLPATPFSELGA